MTTITIWSSACAAPFTPTPAPAATVTSTPKPTEIPATATPEVRTLTSISELGVTDTSIISAFKDAAPTITREAAGSYTVQAQGYQGEQQVSHKYTIDKNTFKIWSEVVNPLIRPDTVEATRVDENGKEVKALLSWQGPERGWHEIVDLSGSDDKTFQHPETNAYFEKDDILTILQSLHLYFLDHPPFTEEAYQNFRDNGGHPLYLTQEKDGSQYAYIRAAASYVGPQTYDAVTSKYSSIWIKMTAEDGQIGDVPIVLFIDYDRSDPTGTKLTFKTFVYLIGANTIPTQENDPDGNLRKSYSEKIYGKNGKDPYYPSIYIWGNEGAKESRWRLAEALSAPGMSLDELDSPNYDWILNLKALLGINPPGYNAPVTLGPENPKGNPPTSSRISVTVRTQKNFNIPAPIPDGWELKYWYLSLGN